MIYGNDKPLSEKEKEKMKYQDNMLNEW
jgi:hypothetical protein